MTILDLQRRYRELGRLRIGATVEGDEGRRPRPVRLSTWRLTSPSRELLERASEVWGGHVQVWEGAPTEGTQFELVTDAEALEVLVPPQDLVGSQYLELWSGGGAKRRCDGATELLSGKPCLCEPMARECSPVTHLVVMLPELPDIGVWRVTTRSWNAGAELPGTVELLAKLAAKGAIPRATVRIEARTVKRAGRTQHFSLPVLEVPWSLAQAEREGVPMLGSDRPAIVAGETELPTDPRFAHDRVDWGPVPEIAEAAEPKPDEGSARADPRAAPAAAGSIDVTVGPAAQPAAEEEVGGGENPPAGKAAAGDDGGAVPEAAVSGGTSAEAPTPSRRAWARFNTALLALPKPELAPAICKRALRAERLEWPPSTDWPVDVLDMLAALLEGAAGHPAGANA